MKNDPLNVKELIEVLKKADDSGYGDYLVVHSFNGITEVIVDPNEKNLILIGVQEDD